VLEARFGSPPWARTSSQMIARSSPLPPGRAEPKNGRNSFSRALGISRCGQLHRASSESAYLKNFAFASSERLRKRNPKIRRNFEIAYFLSSRHLPGLLVLVFSMSS